MSKPIGPVNVAVDPRIEKLPGIILGGAVFNSQYNENPQNLPITNMLRYAFQHGIAAIDTSAYYGPSEELLGRSLKELEAEFPRDHYYICTKAGRVKLDDFDYSPASIRASVLRSCKRLNTTYLDLVYLHDIEFVDVPQTMTALRELRKLKDEGVIRHFGLSGYPVAYLYEICSKCNEDPEIGPLDAILSYSHECIQNTILETFYDRFKALGIKQVSNGSILSMSLLRSQPTKSFHPCSQELRDAVSAGAQLLLNDGVELADLATRFAMNRWADKGPTVIGVSNLQELEAAVNSFWDARDEQKMAQDKPLVERFQKGLGEHLNETWASGNH